MMQSKTCLNQGTVCSPRATIAAFVLHRANPDAQEERNRELAPLDATAS